MEPMMKRVMTGTFIAREEKIYRLYVARLTWPDGKIKDFPSEEHARAWLEDRDPDPKAWEKEIGT